MLAVTFVTSPFIHSQDNNTVIYDNTLTRAADIHLGPSSVPGPVLALSLKYNLLLTIPLMW